MTNIFNRGLDGRGFTLLEVMIGLSILAGTVITVVLSLNYHIGIGERNRDLVVQSVLGKSKIEEIKFMGMPERSEGDFGEAFPGLSWKIEDAGLEFPGLKRLRVTVMRGGKDGTSFETYRLEK